MAKIEVDETEVAASQQLTRLFADVLNNPEARKKFLEAKKVARPNEPIPEIDAAKPVVDMVSGVEKKLDEFLAAQRKEKEEENSAKRVAEFTASWDRSKAKLKAEEGWLDDGLEKVESFAKDRGIPDFEAAAALWLKQNPPPSPTEPSGYGRWDMFNAPSEGESDYMKKLLETRGESEAVVNNEIKAALAEIRGAGARR